MVACDRIFGLISVTVATLLLGLVALDAPVFKGIYFLRIELNSTASAVGNATVGNATVAAALSNTTAHNTTASNLSGLEGFISSELKSLLNLTVRADPAATSSSTGKNNTAKPFVDLGVLGFCTDLQNGKGLQCSKMKIGYSLEDAAAVINSALPSFLIPGVKAVSGTLTKILVVHVVALGISGLSFVCALLAVCGAPVAECFSSCFSGFAGSAALSVFIFDVAFFMIIKSRLNETQGGGTAVLGSAMFLTLTAALLLFITPILFMLGHCCGMCVRSSYERDMEEKRRRDYAKMP